MMNESDLTLKKKQEAEKDLAFLVDMKKREEQVAR